MKANVVSLTQRNGFKSLELSPQLSQNASIKKPDDNLSEIVKEGESPINSLRKNANISRREIKSQESLILEEQNQFEKPLSRRTSSKDLQMKALLKTERIMNGYKSQVTMMNKSVLYQYHQKKNFYDKCSLYLFSGTNPIRKSIVWTVDWKNSQKQRNQALDIAGYVFTAIFTVESVLKIIAYGFIIHRNSYMRNGWNLIDLTVVLSGSLRAFRILRPLRIINAIPSMKKNISALIQSIPDFLNVTAFLMFIFCLMSILGVYQFQGMFSQYCRINPKPETPTSWAKVPEFSERMCSKTGMGNFVCPGNFTCGSPTDYEIALEHDGLYSAELAYFGIYSFDNVGKALLTLHQMVSVDGWYTYMANLADTDFPFLGIFYSFIVIIVGAFYLLNLILAVIIQAFIKVQKKEIDEQVVKLSEHKKALDQEHDQHKEQDIEQSNFQDGQINTEANQTEKKMIKKTNKGAKSTQIVPIQIHSDLSQNNDPSYQQEIKGTSTNKKDIVENQDQQLQKENKIDLSFLKPITTKKKVVNIFQNSNKDVQSFNTNQQMTEEKKVSINFEQKTPEDQNHQSLDDKISQIQAKQQVNFNQESLKSIEKNNDETSKQETQEQNKYISKNTDDPKSKQQFPRNELLAAEQEDQDLDKQRQSAQNTMRQLLTLKLGIKAEKEETDLTKQFNKIRGGYRADRNFVFKWCFEIQKSSIFNFFMSCCIITNTIILSLDRYPIEDEQQALFEHINSAFTVIFVTELLINLTGLGFKQYFSDKFNTFDSCVVSASLVDVFVSNTTTIYNEVLITLFRTFRILRVFKLAKQWKRLENLLITIGRTLKDVSAFAILLFLIIFIYSLLGMELFGYMALFDDDGNLNLENGTTVVENFDNFLDAFTTVFIVLTGDSWSVFYFNMYRATNGYSATIFFVSLMTIGQKVILNLFLAILLENFDEDSLNQDILKQYQEKPQGNLNLIGNFKSRVKKSIKKYFNLEYERSQETLKSKQQQKSAIAQNSQKNSSNLESSKATNANTEKSVRVSGLEKIMIEGKSLWIFGNKNKLRLFLFKLVTHNFFEHFINLIIFISALELALNNPLNDPNGVMSTILFYLDIITTLIFTLEAILKIITYGLTLNGKTSYLRNHWNMLDFIIVIISIISFIPDMRSIKLVQVLRIVRPFRIIGRNQGIKVTVLSLTQAVANIINVSVILLVFFLIFGIICVSQFKGKIYYCDTNDIGDISMMVINNKWDCFNAGGAWFNFFYSLDNIFEAMRMLFLMSTRTGWAKIMYDSIATTEIDYIIIQKYSPYWALFFIAFIFIGAFFLLNLFVGVVISNYNREREKISGANLLTEKQKEWIDTRLSVIKSKPQKKVKIPKNRIRLFLFDIQAHKVFERVITACLTINALIIMLKYEGQPLMMTQITEVISIVFTSIFVAEVAIKIISLGNAYFEDGWNIFDFVVTAGSFVSIFVIKYTTNSLGGASAILNAFKISRVLRLLESFKCLRVVYKTFIVTLPSLVNVGASLLYFFYLYSVVGVILFAEVKRNDLMNDTMNFETFGNSFISLFVIATGDSWDYVVEAAIKKRSIVFQCIQVPSYEDFKNNGYQTIGCGPGDEAHIFFYSFIFLVVLIYLNLFIAIILQGYEDSMNKESRLFNDQTLLHFKKVWAEFDPEATSFILIKELRPLFFKLGEPLGWDESFAESKQKQDKYLISINLPSYNDFSNYQFIDVLDALSLRLLVSENFKKEQKAQDEQDDIGDEDSISRSFQSPKKTIDEMYEEFQIQYQQEINLLKFQEGAQDIEAVQLVEQRELKMKKSQQGNLTSLHQVSAEVAFSHMRYIVQKRKLLRKVDNFVGEKFQSLEKPGAIYNEQASMEKSNLIAQNKDFFENQEDDEHIEDIDNSQAQVYRDSKILSQPKSDQNIGLLDEKSILHGQKRKNSSLDKQSSWSNSICISSQQNEIINEDLLHYDINRLLFQAQKPSKPKLNKAVPVQRLQVQSLHHSVRRTSEASNKQHNMSMGGTGEQLSASDEEEKIDRAIWDRIPSRIIENQADSLISSLAGEKRQAASSYHKDNSEVLQIDHPASQINFSREPSYENLIKFFEIAKSEKDLKSIAKNKKDGANDSMMRDIEAAYNDVL